MTRRSPSGGFTLIEVMVVAAIIVIIMGGAVMGIRSLAKTDLRGDASKLASGMRYLYDRARTTGKSHRLVLDLDQGKYWAEQSSNRFRLDSSKSARAPEPTAQDERDPAQPEEAPTDPKDVDELDVVETGPGTGAPKVLFKSFKEVGLEPITLARKIKIADVYTPKQQDPIGQGRAYIYFFPQGLAERAIIHLQSGDDFYSLVIHPLTGRVVVQAGNVPIPREFDRVDDEGKALP